MQAHNTFEEPDRVKPTAFAGVRLTNAGFAATLPAKSVVALELE